MSQNHRIDERRPCRADCLFLCEYEDGAWVCPAHGEQSYPEYETTNDPDAGEKAELEQFGGGPA